MAQTGVGGALLVLIGTALLVKGAAAAVLLKPAVWVHWLTPGVSTGVAALPAPFPVPAQAASSSAGISNHPSFECIG